jgi:hypothetical protein
LVVATYIGSATDVNGGKIGMIIAVVEAGKRTQSRFRDPDCDFMRKTLMILTPNLRGAFHSDIVSAFQETPEDTFMHLHNSAKLGQWDGFGAANRELRKLTPPDALEMAPRTTPLNIITASTWIMYSAVA